MLRVPGPVPLTPPALPPPPPPPSSTTPQPAAAEGNGQSASAAPAGAVVVYANELEYFGDQSTGNIRRWVGRRGGGGVAARIAVQLSGWGPVNWPRQEVGGVRVGWVALRYEWDGVSQSSVQCPAIPGLVDKTGGCVAAIRCDTAGAWAECGNWVCSHATGVDTPSSSGC